jgi:hypothetical protein
MIAPTGLWSPELRLGTPSSATAAAAWELALDLFFESWRISDRWMPPMALSFRRRALGLSRLIGVAALSHNPAVVEVHLSSARRSLAELDGELDQARRALGLDAGKLAPWIDWSTRLAGQLSNWRLELLGQRLFIRDSKQVIF